MRVQPRKVRIVADEVRGKNAAQAAHILRFHPAKSARLLRKVLISAIANAAENNGADIATLKIVRIQVDEGPRLKRIQARAQGRANRIVKKTSHITVVVDEAPADRVIKPHGTKAKPRPTLEAPKAKGKKKEEAPVAAPVVEETAVEEVVEETQAAAEEVVAETPAAEAAEAEAGAEQPESGEEKGAN